MIDLKMKYINTIKTIEYSDNYMENYDLFNKGIEILKRKINEKDFSEFKDNEREILENIFTIMLE